MIEIPDFVPAGPVEPEVIDEYRDRVPAELIEYWEHYGYGTFASGFVRFINPRESEQAIGGCIGKVTGAGIAVPIMTTGFADLIAWEGDDGLAAVIFREHRIRGLGPTLNTFMNLAIQAGPKHLSRVLAYDLFPAGVEALGQPELEESLVFTPFPAAGGPGTVESLRKRTTIGAIQVADYLLGPVVH